MERVRRNEAGYVCCILREMRRREGKRERGGRERERERESE